MWKALSFYAPNGTSLFDIDGSRHLRTKYMWERENKAMNCYLPSNKYSMGIEIKIGKTGVAQVTFKS